MKTITQLITERLQLNKDRVQRYEYFPETKKELRDIIENLIDKKGNNVDLNELNIPQVDNASLFVLENDDYNIKERAKKMLGTDEKSWLVFNKYGESLPTDESIWL